MFSQKVCDKCPNKNLCKLGVIVGAVSLLASSFILSKKIYKRLTKKKIVKDDQESPKDYMNKENPVSSKEDIPPIVVEL
jgi:hypothetical protein